jgi:hypothetical protein
MPPLAELLTPLESTTQHHTTKEAVQENMKDKMCKKCDFATSHNFVLKIQERNAHGQMLVRKTLHVVKSKQDTNL